MVGSKEMLKDGSLIICYRDPSNRLMCYTENGEIKQWFFYQLAQQMLSTLNSSKSPEKRDWKIYKVNIEKYIR